MDRNDYAFGALGLLIVAVGASSSLPLLAVGLRGQTGTGREVSDYLHQGSQEFPLAATGRIPSPLLASAGATHGLPAPTEAAPARRRTKKTLEHLRGLRVQVLLSDPMSGLTTGSGFWISSEGLVVTCWRNVSHNPDGIIAIQSAAAGHMMQGTLLAQDIHKNLALIKVVPNPFAQTRLSTHNPHLQAAIPALDLPKIGDKLFAVAVRPGRPNLSAQEQSVAAVRPVIELGGELKILLSGVTRYGSAGEPVVDDSGHVVGILEGPYPSPDRTQWGSTEVVIPIQAALELLKRTSVHPPHGA